MSATALLPEIDGQPGASRKSHVATAASECKGNCSRLNFIPVALALIIITLVGLVLATTLVPRLIGGSPLTISTASMAPTLQPGDLAVVQPVHPDSLAMGDVVAFYTHYTHLVAQRIIDFVPGYDGYVTSLVTRTDAAAYSNYSVVSANAIKGRIVYSLPMLGHVAAAPTTLWISLFAGALLPLALWHRSSIRNR